jgi:hypothetical protein
MSMAVHQSAPETLSNPPSPKAPPRSNAYIPAAPARDLRSDTAYRRWTARQIQCAGAVVPARGPTLTSQWSESSRYLLCVRAASFERLRFVSQNAERLGRSRGQRFPKTADHARAIPRFRSRLPTGAGKARIRRWAPGGTGSRSHSLHDRCPYLHRSSAACIAVSVHSNQRQLATVANRYDDTSGH